MVGLILLAHLAVGIVIGVAVDRYVLRPPPGMFFGRIRPMHNDSVGRVEMRAEMRKDMIHRLSKELDLKPEQLAPVESVLVQREVAFEALRRESEPRLQALLDSSWVEIDRVLTPEQHEKWVEIRKHLGPGWGRRGPPGP
jgi:hypothetical protein